MTSIINPKTYSEIIAIINYMPKEYQEKIPEQLLNLFAENQDKTYKIELDKNKELTQYNYGKETRALLAYINLIYWCEKEEKEILYNQYVENSTKHANEIKEKYSLKNLNSNRKIENTQNTVNTLPIEKPKENWIRRIINIIKRILKK